VAPKGDVAYISSDREGGYGGLDLYKFELHKDVRPMMISYVKGIVTDANNGQLLEAGFEIIDLASGDAVIRSSSERGTGEFIRQSYSRKGLCTQRFQRRISLLF
jgi:hypothetical protein